MSLIQFNEPALTALIREIVRQELTQVAPARPERLDTAGVAQRYGIALGTARNWMGANKIPTKGAARALGW